MTRRTSPSATASTLPQSAAALTQAQLDHLLLEVAPRQGRWREEDYLWLTDCTSRRIELTDGHVEVLPMPTDEHQSLVAHLYEVRSWRCAARPTSSTGRSRAARGPRRPRSTA